MRLRPVVAVARHDLLDLRRQRGVWFGLLLIPFATVTFLLLLPGVLTTRQQASAGRATYRVAVQAGDVTEADRAIAALRLPTERLVLRASRDARREVLSGRADVGLRTGDDVAESLAAESPARGEVFAVTSRARSRAALTAFTAALDARATAETRGRLGARGLPPATARPLYVELVDLADTPRGRRLSLAALLPLLVLLPVAGIVGIAAQRISGSKDQRVFEPLLVLPFTRAELMVGKATAAWVIGTISLGAVGLPPLLAGIIPLGARGPSVDLPVWDVLTVVGIGGLMLTLLVALGVTVGAASRTSAELGSVLQLTTLPIFLMGSLLQFRSGLAAQPILLVLPVFGPLLCVRDVAVGSLAYGNLLLATAATVGWSVILLAFAAKLLQSDRSIVRSTS